MSGSEISVSSDPPFPAAGEGSRILELKDAAQGRLGSCPFHRDRVQGEFLTITAAVINEHHSQLSVSPVWICCAMRSILDQGWWLSPTIHELSWL